ILVEQVLESEPEVFLYLPASGELLKHLSLWNDNEGLFGMDFSLSQISNIFNNPFQYVRMSDRKLGDINYFVIDVYKNGDNLNNSLPIMTHQIRQDGMFITRTNFYNQKGKVYKQLSMHDLNKNSADKLNAAMYYMMDRNKLHSTLIKVNKRVVSNSIVSNEVFTTNWMLENKPPLDLNPTEEEQLESELIDASINVFDESIVIRGYR
ncbi:MAG: outer membrane lipoprotein-sorting protein, partial [Gammaproteobacteria bacterium]|nr:outer membrane lipoprotein-sorting protein [Gammaproteobacteria bacterium]